MLHTTINYNNYYKNIYIWKVSPRLKKWTPAARVGVMAIVFHSVTKRRKLNNRAKGGTQILEQQPNEFTNKKIVYCSMLLYYSNFVRIITPKFKSGIKQTLISSSFKLWTRTLSNVRSGTSSVFLIMLREIQYCEIVPVIWNRCKNLQKTVRVFEKILCV